MSDEKENKKADRRDRRIYVKPLLEARVRCQLRRAAELG
jgi:hypothetical protein